MKKSIIFGLIFILLISLVIATTTESWTDSYTDDIGLKTLAGQNCGQGGSSVSWTTLSWTDDSANTTSCVDLAKCRTSSDNSDWGTYSITAVSGASVALEGKYVQCQWNLTNTTSSQCNVSGMNIVCGGFVNDYSASDGTSAVIDFGATIIIAIVGLATIIGLLLVYNWYRKNK